MTVELPEGYKPTPDEDYMSAMQLEYFRQKLLNWRSELLQESENTISHLKEENWQEPDINDRASLETDAALELRTRDRYRKLVNKIDSALARVADGTYGYCDDTGEEIGLFRLEARPIATLTVEAQEKHERLEKQLDDAKKEREKEVKDAKKEWEEKTDLEKRTKDAKKEKEQELKDAKKDLEDRTDVEKRLEDAKEEKKRGLRY